MSSSLIRSSTLGEVDYRTVFTFNFLGSIFLYLVLFVCSSFISSFFDEPRLTNILKVLGFVVIINSSGAIQSTLLTREMAFRKQAFIRVPAVIISSLVAVFLAIHDFGVWSLVYRRLLLSFLTMLLLIFHSDWKPRFGFSAKSFKIHFNYGVFLTVSGLLNTVFNYIYVIVIGKLFSTAQLGYYVRADSLKSIPVNNISSSLMTVSFPAMAKVKSDERRLRNVYLKLFQMVFFSLAPVMIFLIWAAKPLFILLFTEKWVLAVPYFQWLCIVGFLYPFNAYNLNLLKIKGKTKLFLRLEIVKKVIILLGIFFTYKLGIEGLLYFQVGFALLALYINSFYSGRLINLSIVKQLSHIRINFLIVLLLIMVIRTVSYFQIEPTGLLLQVLTKFIITFGIYVLLAYLFKVSSLHELAHLVKRKI